VSAVPSLAARAVEGYKSLWAISLIYACRSGGRVLFSADLLLSSTVLVRRAGIMSSR
jgi:hypothetical protein